MCDTALSFACDQLLPLARDHLLPVLTEAANMIRGDPKEVAELKEELESIEEFINDADRMADAEEDNTRHGIKAKIKKLIEASFRMEDVIDEYMICEARDPGCAGADFVKTMILRLQIAYKIQSIKSRIREIEDTRGTNHGFRIQSTSEHGPSSSIANQNATLLQNLREAPLYMDEADVVGFETSSAKLIDWLVKGISARTVISVVGMGGQGKTTLAKQVFDSKEVVGNFDCRVWITVSQSYSVEGLLRDMLSKFYKQTSDSPPQNIVQMDRPSLIGEVRNCLQQKRYVVVFDDVWNILFWDDIEFAVIDNNNGSRIFITTRNMDVAMSCKKSSFTEVHELQLLTEKKSLELFNKKAFFDLNGCCPENLVKISSELVTKCKGLPLAIVVIGGLLSRKDRNALQWQRFSENLSSELKETSHLIAIQKILGFSYHDLSYNLKSCLLYFGIYPEDDVIKSNRLIRQWIAEGFVQEERGKTLEEVAEGYLMELIHRSLVQVSSITIDGKAKSCHVHDLLRVLILEKFEDLNFCQHISEDGQSSSLSGIIRRLSVATTTSDLTSCIESSHVQSLTSCIESSHVQSLLVFTSELSESSNLYFVTRIPTKYRLLKVLDFGNAVMFYVPKNLKNLIHLKYLRFKLHEESGLPNSIDMLQNLQTLDVREYFSEVKKKMNKLHPRHHELEALDVCGTYISKLPKEISKLRKLRHLLGDNISLIQLKDGIGAMTSLQTLCYVYQDGDADEQVKVIRELGKLKQLRKLGLVGVREEHGSALSSSINEMQHLEKLQIEQNLRGEGDVIDLNLISPSPMLQNIKLHGKLEKLPEWIPQLQNLVKLRLRFSMLTDDPIKSLQNLKNLLSLTITHYAYEGERLHFRDEGFQKLKELYLGKSGNLNSVVIDKGTLNSLEKLELWNIPKLKTVPTGIQYLEKLQFLNIQDMPVPFVMSIGGKEHWIIEHVPLVHIDHVPLVELFAI